jgi:hypothetical protein
MSNLPDYFRVSPQGRIRLGLGDVVDSDSKIALWRAREAFLLALQETAPHIVKDMVGNTQFFQLWCEYLELETSLESQYSSNGRLTGEIPDTVKTAASALFDVVAMRAKQWNLKDPWIAALLIEAVTDPATLLQRLDPNSGELRIRVGLTANRVMQVIAPLLRPPGPLITLAGKEFADTDYWPMVVLPTNPDSGENEALFDWNPASESRAENEVRAVEWFTARYRDAQDARLKEAEERYPNRAQNRLYDHFVWLVQFQALEWSYSKVAKEANRSRQAVTEAIRNTASLIGLKRRDED